MGHRTYLTVSNGFAGWGWLSFAAWLVALVLAVTLTFATRTPRGKRLDNRIVAWVTMTAGAAELLGNWLSIGTAPKTWLGGGAGEVASKGVGLTIATVAGAVLIASGLLMLFSGSRQPLASVERGAADMLVG